MSNFCPLHTYRTDLIMIEMEMDFTVVEKRSSLDDSPDPNTDYLCIFTNLPRLPA